MGATPIFALPYPEPTDPADVPTDMHELALAVEGVLDVAGGDLTGAFPNPQIASGAVTNPKIASLSIDEGKLQDSAVTNRKILDGTIAVAKLARKYDLGYSALFNIAAGPTFVDIGVFPTVSYGVAPVYVGTLDLSQSSDLTFGEFLRMTILNPTATSCTFRIHNTASAAGINNLRIAWHSIG